MLPEGKKERYKQINNINRGNGRTDVETEFPRKPVAVKIERAGDHTRVSLSKSVAFRRKNMLRQTKQQQQQKKREGQTKPPRKPVAVRGERRKAERDTGESPLRNPVAVVPS